MNTNFLIRMAPVILSLGMGCEGQKVETPCQPTAVTYTPTSYGITAVRVNHLQGNQYHTQMTAWVARSGTRHVSLADVGSFFSGRTMQNVRMMGATAVHPSSSPSLRFQGDPHPLSPYFVMNIRTGTPVTTGAVTVIGYTCDPSQPSTSSTGSRAIYFDRCRGSVSIAEQPYRFIITNTSNVWVNSTSIPGYVQAVSDCAPTFVIDTLERGLSGSMRGALQALTHPQRVSR